MAQRWGGIIRKGLKEYVHSYPEGSRCQEISNHILENILVH